MWHARFRYLLVVILDENGAFFGLVHRSCSLSKRSEGQKSSRRNAQRRGFARYPKVIVTVDEVKVGLRPDMSPRESDGRAPLSTRVSRLTRALMRHVRSAEQVTQGRVVMEKNHPRIKPRIREWMPPYSFIREEIRGWFAGGGQCTATFPPSFHFGDCRPQGRRTQSASGEGLCWGKIWRGL